MIQVTRTKLVKITPPQAIVDNTSWTTATIDTLGFRHARIIVHFGAMDIAMAALKVQESDDSGMSGAADVTGAVGGTDFTLPSASDDDHFFVFNVSLKGNRKRYLDVVATGGDGSAGTYMTAFVELSRGESTPNSATTRGLTTEVSV